MSRFYASIGKFKRWAQKELNFWSVASLIGAAVILLPILFVAFSLFQKENENWHFIRTYLLKDYILHSLHLSGMTALLSVLIGVGLAWVVAAYDFPLRRFFRVGLLLPLAIPPYIGAYTYHTMLSYTGVVQSTLRNQFGVTPPPQWFDIMSTNGAIFIFTIFLFPYVYLIARAFLENQSSAFVESARLFGRRPVMIFVRVLLPLARPAIIGGVMLVVYEVLSDYGVTSYFGVQTVTTAIFQTWFGLYDVDSAMRLAAWLMVLVVGLLILERVLRSRRMYKLSNKAKPLTPIRLRGWQSALAVAFCSAVFMLGFLIPVTQLLYWSWMTFADVWKPSFVQMALQTIYVASLATLLIMIFSLLVANVTRARSLWSYVLSKMVTAGYSIPGAIIAIGILAVFISLDHALAPVYAWLGVGKGPLVLSMSLAMLVTGYVIRFMATGYNAVEVGFEKIGRQYTESARLLGMGVTRTFWRVDLPLVKGAVAGGSILTFVEICKELPLALLLRPFNFETLATKTYQYAHDEQIHEASTSSLLIIAISLLSVMVIEYLEKRVRS